MGKAVIAAVVAGTALVVALNTLGLLVLGG